MDPVIVLGSVHCSSRLRRRTASAMSNIISHNSEYQQDSQPSTVQERATEPQQAFDNGFSVVEANGAMTAAESPATARSLLNDIRLSQRGNDPVRQAAL